MRRMDPKVNEDALEEALATIEGARSWSPRLVSRLEHHVRTAPDEELVRLNPLAWAADRGIDEYETVDLFLHGARVGLFNMVWNVICPCCGKVLRSLREPHDVIRFIRLPGSCGQCLPERHQIVSILKDIVPKAIISITMFIPLPSHM